MTYEVGDALGVFPANCPALVEEILRALNCSGEEAVPGKDGAMVALREALLRHYEITQIPKPFLKAAARTRRPYAETTRLRTQRRADDISLGPRNHRPAARASGVKFEPEEFVALLRKLQPRLYSISSSPKAHPGQVHLTVNSCATNRCRDRARAFAQRFWRSGSGRTPPCRYFFSPTKISGCRPAVIRR